MDQDVRVFQEILHKSVPLLWAIRIDDAMLDELVRQGVVERWAAHTLSKEERLHTLVDSISVSRDRFARFLQVLAEKEEHGPLIDLLKRRMENMAQGSEKQVTWQGEEVLIEISIQSDPETDLDTFLKRQLELWFTKSSGDPIHLEIIALYGIFIKEVSPTFMLTAELLETAKPSKLIADIRVGKLAATLGRHLNMCDLGQTDLTFKVQLDDASETKLQQFIQVEEGTSERDEVGEEEEGEPGARAQAVNQTRRMTILSNILMGVITSKQPLAQFYNLLMKYKAVPDITMLESPNGLPLLHECIIHQRSDLLVAFFYCSLWKGFYGTRVKIPSSKFFNQSPLEFAQIISNEPAQLELERLEILYQAIMQEPLMIACLHGNIEGFKELSSKNPKDVMRVIAKLTCLDLAIGSGSMDMVKMVCQTEKKVRFKRQQYDDQLRLCVELSQANIIFILSTFTSLNANITGPPGKSLMERAAEIGDVQTFQALLDIGGRFPVTALCLASSSGQAEFVKACLTSYHDLVDLTYQDKRQKTAILFAIEKDHFRIVELLLNSVTDITHADKRGRTVFHYAADKGNLEVLKLLLEKAKGMVNIQQLLQQHDYFLGNELCFLVKGTTEGHAAWHYILADRALIHDFKVNMRKGSVDVGVFGKMITSGWGDQPSIDKVKEVESKFDSQNIPDNAPVDMTPLHIAVLKDHTEVALLLIKEMEEVNPQDHFQLTPLHLACMRGNLQVIKALELKQARWDLTDTKGRTPAEVARLNDHDHVLQYLKEGSLQRATQTFMQASIAPVMGKLTVEEMEKRLEEGVNIKEFVKETLRDLNGDISTFLYDHLKSGPIMAASDE